MTRPVETYSGFRVDERPTRFLWEGSSVEVEQIVSQWREPEEDCFRVIGDDGNPYFLRRGRNGDWTVTKARDATNDAAK